MGFWERSKRAAVLVPLLAAFACGLRFGPGASPGPAGPGEFSGSKAWDHLEELSDIGPRTPGSAGSERARSYLLGQLESLEGAQVRAIRFPVAGASHREIRDAGSGSAVEGVNLVGILAGRSPDIIVLAASYDSPSLDGFRYPDSNATASGPALVLELGRALSNRPRPFTVWIVLLDGDAVGPGSGPDRHGFEGSRELVETLGAEGRLEQVRAAFFFERVADPDLAIARDLHSHGAYRDVFFEVAEERGLDDAFPRKGNFRQPRTGHRVFLDRGFRRVVAIVDPQHVPEDAPGVSGHSPGDPSQTSKESLSAVGSVALEAVDRIQRRLEKVDRFADPPLPAKSAGQGTPERSRGTN